MIQNPQNPDLAGGAPLNQDSANLAGMSAAAAKEYIFGFVSTLKLTEKEIRSLEEDAARWKSRADLARSRGIADLLAEAEKEAGRANARLETLREEEQTLKHQIDTMRRQLPGLAARERSIDADLLEQELLMALGQSGEEAKTEKAFRELEKEHAADAALQALKARMKD
ncbi:MAG: chromosome partitioning protein [Treponema sp.]|nr:chromosome partitioning protein [Treponema sp.]